MSAEEELKKITALLTATLAKLENLEHDVVKLKERETTQPASNVAVLHTIQGALDRDAKQTSDILNSPLLNKAAEAIMECKKRGVFDKPS